MLHKINFNQYKLVIFLGISLLIGCLGDNFSFDKTLKGRVQEVLDGDTLIIHGQKVRLIGIDAPELDQKSFDGVPIGEMSKSYLEKLVRRKVVRVVYSKTGYYGRILGEVYTDKYVNKEMLLEGMAIFSRYSKRRDLYLAGYLARLKRKGIFGTSGFLNPYNFRRKKSRD